MFRTAIDALPAGTPIGIELETELGGNDHLITNGRERLAYKFLIRKWSIDLGGVKEVDTPVHSCPQQRDHFLLVLTQAIRSAHTHAAEAKGRDFQIAFSQFALLHCSPRDLSTCTEA